MKFLKLILAAFLMVGFLAPAYGQSAPVKIGLVDFQKALNEVEEGKRAKAGLKAQFETKQQTLNAKQEALKKLKDDIEARKAALSADAMRQKEAEYRDKFLDLQKTLAQFRQEMATKEAEMTEGIVKRLRATVQNIGKKDKFDIIFEKSQETVLYAPQAVDLTGKVISSFNAGK